MAEGGNKYWVIIQAVLEQIKQSQVEAAFKNTRPVTIDVNIANKNAKEQIAKIESQLGSIGDKVKTQAIFKSDELTKYSAEVTHIASGVQTVSKYIVDVNKEGQQTTTLIDSIATQTSKLSLIEQQSLGVYKEKTKALQLQEMEINRVKNIEQQRQTEEYNLNAKLKTLTEQRQLDEYNSAGKTAAQQKAINEKRQKEEYDLNAKLKALMEERQKAEYDSASKIYMKQKSLAENRQKQEYDLNAKAIQQQENLAESTKKYELQLEGFRTKHADAYRVGGNEIEKLDAKVKNLIKSNTGTTTSTHKLKNAQLELGNAVAKTEKKMAIANQATDNLGTSLLKAMKKTVIWATAMTVLYGSLRKFQEGIQYITDLNTEMTNIQIVTGDTDAQVSKLAGDYNELAKKLGVTTLEVAKGNLEWARQGKSAEDSSKLLRASVMMGKLANLEQAQSTEYLTSIINGYKLSIEEVMPTIDKLVALDNAYATSVGEVAEALQKTASTSKLAGVSLDQMAAMISIVSDTMRAAPETIGQAFSR
jgi:hypothetical protein